MEQQIARWVEALTDRDDRYAYACFQELVAASRKSSAVYAYLDRFASLLESKSGFQRARGFGLIVENAQWDTENQIEQLLDELLARIADEKPTVARQAIQAAPRLVRDKPALRARVVAALAGVQPARYKDTMEPLIRADVERALQRIGAEEGPEQTGAAR